MLACTKRSYQATKAELAPQLLDEGVGAALVSLLNPKGNPPSPFPPSLSHTRTHTHTLAAALAALALTCSAGRGSVHEEERVLAPVCEALRNLAVHDNVRGRLILEGPVMPLARRVQRQRKNEI